MEAISRGASSLSAHANEFPALFDVCYAADRLRADAPTASSAGRSVSETGLISPGSSSRRADIYPDPSDDLASPICRGRLFRDALMEMASLMGGMTGNMETLAQILSEDAAKYLIIMRAFVG